MVEYIACSIILYGFILCFANYRFENNKSRRGACGWDIGQCYLSSCLYAFPHFYRHAFPLARMEECCLEVGLWTAYYRATICTLLYSYTWGNLRSSWWSLGYGFTQY